VKSELTCAFGLAVLLPSRETGSNSNTSGCPDLRHCLSIRLRINSSNHREFGQAGQKERGARKPHKRLLYCVNVNRTSLDHLLLGSNADVNKDVE
jgi:hypothetical protein